MRVNQRKARRRDRPGLSLRATFTLVLFVCGLYAGGISLFIAFRVLPATRVLRMQSVALTEFTPRLTLVTMTLRKAIDDIHTMTTALRRGATPAVVLRGKPSAVERVEWLLETDAFVVSSSALRGYPDARESLAQAMGNSTRASHLLLDALASLEVGDYPSAYVALGRADTLSTAVSASLGDLWGRANRAMVASERSLGRLADGVRRTVTWWLAGGLVLLLFITILLRRRFYQPLAELTHGLDRVGAGDLGVDLTVRRADELGQLRGHFNQMTAVLRERADEEEQRRHNLTERLGRVLEGSTNEIVIIDAETLRLLHVNQAACRNLGYDRDALLQRTPMDITDLSRDQLNKILRPLREGKVDHVRVFNLNRRADSSTYPVEVDVQFSKDEQPPVFVAIAQDITERLRLQAERDRIFDQSVDMLATATLDGYLTRVNPAFQKTLGLTPELLLSRHVLDFVHPDDIPRAKKQMRKMEAGEGARSFEVRCRHVDGTYRWLSWNCNPADDGVLYAVARDVTEQKEAEARQMEMARALERAAQEWRVTFDTIDDPVVLVDEAGMVRRLNEKARELAGLEHSDILGRRVGSIGDSPLWQRAEEIAESARAGNTIATQVSGNGTGKTWVLKASVVRTGDVGRGSVIVIAHDVTPLVRLQASLRRSETMAEMGSLVAGVAHEVRNPLFAMSATLDALEARYGIREDSMAHVEVFRSQLDRMTQLMQELLDYGKPPTLDLEFETLGTVIGAAIEENKEMAQECGVTIREASEPALPKVKMDRMRLTQVFDNLVTNAIQHSDRGESVTITTNLICQDGRDWVETQVCDSGPGFSADDLEHIFEPFFTRRQGGTGLGLALVRRIIDQHGGSVRAENRTHGGASICVRLPL